MTQRERKQVWIDAALHEQVRQAAGTLSGQAKRPFTVREAFEEIVRRGLYDLEMEDYDRVLFADADADAKRAADAAFDKRAKGKLKPWK